MRRSLMTASSLALVAAFAVAGIDLARDAGTWWANGSEHRAPSAHLIRSVTKEKACISETGARVCFSNEDQRFWVQDTQRNGESAVVKWAAADRQGHGYCRNAHRKGSWAVCPAHFKSGTIISFRAGLFDMDATGKGRHGHFDNRDKGRFVGGWSEIQVAKA